MANQSLLPDPTCLHLLHLEADVLQGPKFLNLVALNNLQASDEINGVACETAHLTGNHVAQCGVAFALRGSVPDQVPSVCRRPAVPSTSVTLSSVPLASFTRVEPSA